MASNLEAMAFTLVARAMHPCIGLSNEHEKDMVLTSAIEG